MGSVVSALFTLLLGWLKGTAQWLWNLISSDSKGGLIGWIVKNWLPLVILLSIFGIATDFVIYLLRWQPYRAWRSRLTRLLPKKVRPATNKRRLIYADGTTVEEEMPIEQTRKIKPKQERKNNAVQRRKRVIPARKRFMDPDIDYAPPLHIEEDNKPTGGQQ